MGVQADMLRRFDTDEVFPLLLGTVARVRVDLEEWNGKTNPKVTYVADPSGNQAAGQSGDNFNWDK